MVDASSIREAKLKLRSDGIFVKSITEDLPTAPKASREVNLSGFFTRVKLEDVTIMTRQLATLVGASIPLVEALSALYEQTEVPALKKAVAQIRDSVNEGSSFADALSRHRKIFPDLYINMVRSGEASGALDIVLVRLAEFMESQQKLKSKVSAAMIYPIILLVICVAVLFYLLAAVVPKIVTMFDSMDQVLPLPTRILIGASDFLAAAWWAVLLVVAVVIYAIKKWRDTESGAYTFDRMRMNLPVFGELMTKVAVARFARTLGTLLASGVPIIEALRIVQTIVLNKVMERALDDVTTDVTEGSSIAAPLKKSGVFPPIIVHMISVGEKSGRLEEMLNKAADSYEDDVDTSVSALSSVLEPLMIVFMGVTVGFVVMAIMMPMLEMSTVVR